ncbi:EamA family transporter [Clostridium akagii]|uniref:EamA family transporter n=1 Tax=Clostridium akagii TaxID=91623 RepID=UPI00047C2688|nr:EamA family transporter [Clostridium akagii]
MTISIIIYLICTVAGLVFIKMGSQNTGIVLKSNVLSIDINVILILGFLFYIISFLLWIKILKGNSLSYIVPITTGLSQILILIASVLVFKENITMFKGVGVIIVLVGVIVINLGK